MKQLIFCAALSLVAPVSYANQPNSAIQAKFLGISETDQVVTQTSFASSGSEEVFTVFKDPQSLLSFQIENKDSKGHATSTFLKFRNGNTITENFGPDGQVVSRIQTKPNGESETENF